MFDASIQNVEVTVLLCFGSNVECIVTTRKRVTKNKIVLIILKWIYNYIALSSFSQIIIN